MEREQNIATALAAASVALAETVLECDQLKKALDWKTKKCDALMAEGQKLRSDLSAAYRELENVRTAGKKAVPEPKEAEA